MSDATDLPPSGLYREIAQCCGVETARALYLNCAGQAIKPPRGVTEEHTLAQRIGLVAAQRLCEHFCGEQLEMPTRWITGAQLARVVVLRYTSGGKVNHIARDLRLTRRHVERILDRHKGAPPAEADSEPAARRPAQLDLF